MKAKIYLLFIIVFSQYNLFAQDIIVKSNYDTLDCIINKVEDDYIKYQIYDGYDLRIRTIKNEDYISYQEGFYVQPEKNVPILMIQHSHYIVTNSFDTIYCNIIKRSSYFIVYEEKIEGKDIISKIHKNQVSEVSRIKKKSTYQTTSSVEFSLQGGYGARLGSIPSTYEQPERDISKQLNSGYYLGGGFRAYIIPHLALGVYFSSYNSDASGYLPIVFEEEDEPEYFGADVKLSINYIAGEAVLTFYTKNKTLSFSPFFNVGQINYKETTEIEGIEVIAKGKKLGWGLGGNMIYFLTPEVGFMIKTQIISGSLSRFTVTSTNYAETFDLPDDELLDIGRLEIGLGFVIKI